MKYKILKNQYAFVNETKVYRIQALKNFSDVKVGDIGGYVQSEKNLSHAGDCWIYPNAKVFGNAMVHGNAKIYNNAIIYDNAYIFENATISGNVIIGGDTMIKDNAKINGDIKINGWNIIIAGDACINKESEIFWITKIGSLLSTTTFYKMTNNSIGVTNVCFVGNIEKFHKKVKEIYKRNNIHRKEYELAIKMAKIKLKG